MPAIVLDASAFVELVLRSRAGREVERELRGATAAVPAHFDAEVLSALGWLSRAAELADERVEAGLDLLARAPFRRYALAPLLGDAWELRRNVSLRDALYVALARHLEAGLLTADARLARAGVPGASVTLAG